jgi:hypothetical protein
MRGTSAKAFTIPPSAANIQAMLPAAVAAAPISQSTAVSIFRVDMAQSLF